MFQGHPYCLLKSGLKTNTKVMTLTNYYVKTNAKSRDLYQEIKTYKRKKSVDCIVTTTYPPPSSSSALTFLSSFDICSLTSQWKGVSNLKTPRCKTHINVVLLVAGYNSSDTCPPIYIGIYGESSSLSCSGLEKISACTNSHTPLPFNNAPTHREGAAKSVSISLNKITT